MTPLLPGTLFPDCEAPLKKEGGLPEGPVLEALLCAETGEKKVELKEEETIMDCQVGLPSGHSSYNLLSPRHLPGMSRSCSETSPGSLGPLDSLNFHLPRPPQLLQRPLTCPLTPNQGPHFLDPNHPSPGAQKQQLLEFPHDLEVEDLEDDIPRRKNRAKGKVSPHSFFLPHPVPTVTDPIY